MEKCDPFCVELELVDQKEEELYFIGIYQCLICKHKQETKFKKHGE